MKSKFLALIACIIFVSSAVNAQAVIKQGGTNLKTFLKGIDDGLYKGGANVRYELPQQVIFDLLKEKRSPNNSSGMNIYEIDDTDSINFELIYKSKSLVVCPAGYCDLKN